MPENTNSNILLSLLEGFKLDNADDIAKEVADNFRKRRVEKILPGNLFPSSRESLCQQWRVLSRKALYLLNLLLSWRWLWVMSVM